jgi:uncharacterized membrane protein
MSVLVLMIVLSAIAYLPQYVLGNRKDYRMAMRHGMAGMFLFTGLDHFFTPSRYIPMMPPFLADYALELVYLSGLAELAGALGLLVPLAVYRWLKLPNLRPLVGLGLALMLSVIVIANINVAVQGLQVQGLPFPAWYYWVRVLLQPVFVVWALFVAGVIRRPAPTAHTPRPFNRDLPLPR